MAKENVLYAHDGALYHKNESPSFAGKWIDQKMRENTNKFVCFVLCFETKFLFIAQAVLELTM